MPFHDFRRAARFAAVAAVLIGAVLAARVPPVPAPAAVIVEEGAFLKPPAAGGFARLDAYGKWYLSDVDPSLTDEDRAVLGTLVDQLNAEEAKKKE